jgi:cysteine desulfurase/selenocysteine lyase
VDSENWVEAIREDFPALRNRRHGKRPIYFDNACTTLVPRQVIAAVNEYYRQFPACGGERSRYWFAEEVASRIEGNPERGMKGSRQIIKEFIHARDDKEIIFTLNTSQAISLVALGFRFQPGDVVLLTDKEHNSNLVPWLRLQKLGRIRVEHVGSGEDDTFDLDGFQKKLENNSVRLVSLGCTSNLTGYTIPAQEIIRMAHTYGARVLLDGAQTVPHQAVDVQELDVDFLAFSIHKMCGPGGVGILYGKQALLGQEEHEEADPDDAIEPVMLGGGTVGDTTYGTYSLLEPPERFEVGLQNYPGQIAAAAAVRYLQQVGLDRIHAQENRLNRYLTEQLLNRYGDTGWFRILGPQDVTQRGGILTFVVRRPNAVGIAEELDEKSNVMIRDGAFCVHAYLNREFGQGWTRPRLPAEHQMTYRVSLYFYNTLEECRIFLETLHNIFEERSYI